MRSSGGEGNRDQLWVAASSGVALMGLANSLFGLFNRVPLVWIVYTIAPLLGIGAAVRRRFVILGLCWLVTGVGALVILGPAIGIWPTWLPALLAIFPLVVAFRERDNHGREPGAKGRQNSSNTTS